MDGQPASVERFAAIEGLRALLAWGVFVGHIILFAGLSRVGIPDRVGELATVCVEIFIIVSGFVITHLLLNTQDTYLSYITKRFFRLFPAYSICAACGAAVIAISRTPWPSDPGYLYGQQLLALKDTQAQHLAQHVLLHLTLLHGLVPNNILNFSQWALLPTAWSLSLEWQFYLVAPAALLLFRMRGGPVAVALVTIAGLFLYARGYLGTFQSPSILAGAAELFLLGIASRLCWREVSPRAPAAVAALALVGGLLAAQMAIACWVAFLVYLFSRGAKLEGINRAFVNAADALFTSSFAQWASKRTYCVYLVHYPVYQLLLTALTIAGFNSPLGVAGLLFLLGLPLTAITAEALHRSVEVPGMRIGKEVAASLRTRSGAHCAARRLEAGEI